MIEKAPKIRLFVDGSLHQGGMIALGPDQAHYLRSVMRLETGTMILLFNGHDGEWLGKLVELGKRKAVVALSDQVREQITSPDVWLLFAPVKKVQTHFIVEKATELGARKVWPVYTHNTETSRVNQDRMIANMVEAAEQCRRLDVPELGEPLPLEAALLRWPEDRTLYVMDETGEGETVNRVLSKNKGPSAFLIGPEGGFTPEELTFIKSHPFVTPISLGKRILRAETAALAALTCYQAFAGDWTDGKSS